jgi:hypothetical protein
VAPIPAPLLVLHVPLGFFATGDPIARLGDETLLKTEAGGPTVSPVGQTALGT